MDQRLKYQAGSGVAIGALQHLAARRQGPLLQGPVLGYLLLYDVSVWSCAAVDVPSLSAIMVCKVHINRLHVDLHDAMNLHIVIHGSRANGKKAVATLHVEEL